MRKSRFTDEKMASIRSRRTTFARLKQLELENAKLKRIVAERDLRREEGDQRKKCMVRPVRARLASVMTMQSA
jgi:hypothetical protein